MQQRTSGDEVSDASMLKKPSPISHHLREEPQPHQHDRQPGSNLGATAAITIDRRAPEAPGVLRPSLGGGCILNERVSSWPDGRGEPSRPLVRSEHDFRVKVLRTRGHFEIPSAFFHSSPWVFEERDYKSRPNQI